MTGLTQSRPENCLQTCIAMLLGVDPESMPQQHELEQLTDRAAWGLALRVYLDKHHGLTYVEIGPDEYKKALATGIDHHVLIGECSRTTKERYVWHAIVGRRGEPVWDVSPSREGLTKVTGWGLLVPTPKEFRATWAGTQCLCRDCASKKAVAA